MLIEIDYKEDSSRCCDTSIMDSHWEEDSKEDNIDYDSSILGSCLEND